MKEVRIEVPNTQVEVVEDYLKLVELNPSKLELIGGNILFILTVDDNTSNHLLHELKARGVGVVFGNISMIPLALFISGSQTTNTVQRSSAANLEEILANIEDSAVVSGTYIALVLLSGALAAFGLLEESIVIIIGSMIVAPLMGPIALTSIGVLLPQRGLFRKGLTAEGLGILLTIGMGFLVGFVVGEPDQIPNQMAIRADPSEIDIVFAIISAVAAGVIISKGQSLSIVGVAIAASLAPPAANIGLYLSFGKFEEAELAGILLLINILAINASCSIMFILFKLPAKAGISKRRATRAQKMSQLFTTGVLFLLIVVSVLLIRPDLFGF